MNFIPVAGKILAKEIPSKELISTKVEIFTKNIRENMRFFKIEKKAPFLKTNFILKDKKKQIKHKELIDKNFKAYSSIKEGDIVVIKELAGTEILLEGKSYFILQPLDIVAKINE